MGNVLLVENCVQEFLKATRSRIVPATYGWESVGRRKITSRTYENYACMIKHFVAAFKGRTLDSITVQNLKDFFETKRALSNETINRLYRVIAMFYDWALNTGQAKTNLLYDYNFVLPCSTKIPKRVDALSDEELQKLCRAVRGNKILCPLILLMIHTGMRTEEVIALKWKMIDWKTGHIQIEFASKLEIEYDDLGEKIGKRQSVCGRTKNRTSVRGVFVDKEMLRILWAWRIYAEQHTKTKFGADDFVFGNTYNPCWTYGGLKSSLKKVLNREIGENHKINLHRIRHTTGTMLAEQQATTLEIMQQLGDRCEQSVMRYVSQSNKIALENQRRISTAWSNLDWTSEMNT